METTSDTNETTAKEPRAFRAKYPGKCVFCHEGIKGPSKKGADDGDLIAWNRLVKGQVGHFDCFAKNNGKFPESESGQAAQKATETRTSPEDVNTGSTLADEIFKAIKPILDTDYKPKAMDEDSLKVLMLETLEKHFVKRVEMVYPSGETKDCGTQHKKFPLLLKAIPARQSSGDPLNFWVTGPAGTGKSTGAKMVADVLGYYFAQYPKIVDSSVVFGFISQIDGKYHGTPARQAYEHGGVLLLDDFDGIDPNVATELQGFLANSHFQFPDALVKRHENCVIILTANTYGLGGTSDYVGRLRQDKAFLNRFVFINWDVDEALELTTAGNGDWTRKVQKVRANVKKQGLQILITPRASYYGAALLAQGIEEGDVVDMVLRQGMTDEQWANIKY